MDGVSRRELRRGRNRDTAPGARLFGGLWSRQSGWILGGGSSRGRISGVVLDKLKNMSDLRLQGVERVDKSGRRRSTEGERLLVQSWDWPRDA